MINGILVEMEKSSEMIFTVGDQADSKQFVVSLGTVDSEKLKPYRAYIVHFVSLLKVLLSILHLNTIIALFFHF